MIDAVDESTMAGEEQGETTADRVYDTLDRAHRRYKALEGRVRDYTPTVVRAFEVVLAIVLAVGLARWLYLFYLA